jgi:hypothetical protein
VDTLINEAFRLAVESVQEAAGPCAFVLTLSSTGAKTLTRLIGVENSEAAIEAGRARVRASGATAYVIAFDSFLRAASGERFDADLPGKFRTS